jgi:hypothetical protein
MRRWIAFVLGLLGALPGLPAPALAACGGTDQLAALVAENPAARRTLERRAAAVPNGRGIFWRVERPGAAASYLLGTFHDTEIAEEPLDPRVRAALGGARVMVVEISADEMARMQQRMATDPGFAFDLTGPGIAARLAPEDRAAADAALARRGLSLALVDRMRPAFLFSILAQPQCALDAMAAGKPVLDAVLMARAAAAGVPILGMETYADALDSIDSLAPETLDRLLADALLNLDRIEDFRRTSVALYRRGDTGMLQEFEIWTGEAELGEAASRRLYSSFSEALIEGRNRAWMKTLVPELERGGVFAAFGALHLPGVAGVVELLRQRGFTVTRLDG